MRKRTIWLIKMKRYGVYFENNQTRRRVDVDFYLKASDRELLSKIHKRRNFYATYFAEDENHESIIEEITGAILDDYKVNFAVCFVEESIFDEIQNLVTTTIRTHSRSDETEIINKSNSVSDTSCYFDFYLDRDETKGEHYGFGWQTELDLNNEVLLNTRQLARELIAESKSKS